MDFKKWMTENTKNIDSQLNQYLPEKNAKQIDLYKSMRYSLLSSGKRIRPLLTIASYELYRQDTRLVMPFACALEMVHAYSLIHDDLPAMDNDALRRGKPTNHIVFGEAMAILAGDALLNKAFETVLNFSDSSISPEQKLQCMQLLASASGSEGMIGGQVVDMFVNEKTQSELEYRHRLKTGALIISACQIGATLGGATHHEINLLTDFAQYLGLAFQIKDDILDCTANEEELGKPINSDQKNDKLTYVSLLGLEESENLLNEYTKKAVRSLHYFGSRGNRLNEIALYLLERKK